MRTEPCPLRSHLAVIKAFHIGDAAAKKACIKHLFFLLQRLVQTDHCGKRQSQCENPYSKYHAQFSFFAASIKIS